MVFVIASAVVAAALWVREFRTPSDRAAHRRLMRELRRHEAEFYEHQP